MSKDTKVEEVSQYGSTVVEKDESIVKLFLNYLFKLFLISIIIFCAVFFIIPKLLGGGSDTILSGSMRPSIDPGDVVVILPYGDESSPKVGDVITYYPKSGDDTKITHRVISTVTDINGDILYRLQGDDNGQPDPELVKTEQIIGEVKVTIPKIGYLVNSFQNFVKDKIGGLQS